MVESTERSSLIEHLGDLEDPGKAQGQRHSLLHVVIMTICAVGACAEEWDGVELFATAGRNGWAGFWSWPTAFPAQTTSPECLPASSRSPSESGSRNG